MLELHISDANSLQCCGVGLLRSPALLHCCAVAFFSPSSLLNRLPTFGAASPLKNGAKSCIDVKRKSAVQPSIRYDVVQSKGRDFQKPTVGAFRKAAQRQLCRASRLSGSRLRICGTLAVAETRNEKVQLSCVLVFDIRGSPFEVLKMEFLPVLLLHRCGISNIFPFLRLVSQYLS